MINLLCISSGAGTGPAAWSCALEGVHTEAVDPWEAVECLKTSRVDAVLVRLPLDDWTPEDMLEQIQRIDGALPVIFSDTEGKLADGVRLTQLGAFHYLAANDADELLEMLERAAEHSRSHRLALVETAGANEPWRKFLVGESQPIQRLARVIRLVSPRALDGTDFGRDWRRKGNGGARHPHGQRPCAHAAGGGQLHGVAGKPARSRAVRSC